MNKIGYNEVSVEESTIDLNESIIYNKLFINEILTPNGYNKCQLSIELIGSSYLTPFMWRVKFHFGASMRVSNLSGQSIGLIA